jgi:ion channel
MRIFTMIAGIVCLFAVLLDAFQTIILPRRATGRFRLTRIFYIVTWRPWRFFTRRLRDPRKRESAFSYYGPLSLIFLLVVWAGSMVVGFALIFYSLGSPFNDSTQSPGLRSDLYVSGTTIFTLGLGDVTPHSAWARELIILEAGTGFGFLAVVMGYFPVLYSAFSRREVSISLLDARAGSPPTAAELMRRHSYEGGNNALSLLLLEWERWSAELLESHISYPLLCYFRSQHNNQSWISALTAVLDTSALLIAGVKGHEARQAQLTFAMARHAMVDLAQIFSLAPMNNAPDRLPPERYEQLYTLLCQSGVKVCRDGRSIERLRDMRALYEGYAAALADYLNMPLPPWIADKPHKDNWLAVARLRAQTEAADSPSDNEKAINGSQHTISALVDDHHDF